MEKELIAPCGMNCGICHAYLRTKDKCPGCFTQDGYGLHSSCRQCTIRNCETIKSNESGFCYECATFPCRRLKQLDKRYTTKYGMSMLENLDIIKNRGIAALLAREEEKWICPECGGTISCHEGFCHRCALEKRKKRQIDKASESVESTLIAPCGMNCGICSSYLAMKYDVRKKGLQTGYCAGCRPRDKQCAFLMKSCRLLLSGEVEYCFECDEFPCENLLKINAKYSEDFHMSMVDNLRFIKDNGMESFLDREKDKWRCPQCGGTISCHNGICYSCGVEKLKSRKKIHAWEDN